MKVHNYQLFGRDGEDLKLTRECWDGWLKCRCRVVFPPCMLSFMFMMNIPTMHHIVFSFTCAYMICNHVITCMHSEYTEGTVYYMCI